MTSRDEKCMYPFKKESRKSEKFQTYTRLHTSNSKRPWQPSRSDTSGHRFIPKSLETFLINTSLKSFCTFMEYEAPLNYTSEQFPLISPAKRREISGRAPSYFEELERKCAEATPQLTLSDWDEADLARSAQIKPRAQTEETHRADRSKSPPPPWIHTGSACRSLPDKLWELKKKKTLASWEYAALALGAVDISRLDGNHVTAAGDHGTEQVRLTDPREQSAPRQQEGTCRSRCCAVGLFWWWRGRVLRTWSW